MKQSARNLVVPSTAWDTEMIITLTVTYGVYHVVLVKLQGVIIIGFPDVPEHRVGSHWLQLRASYTIADADCDDGDVVLQPRLENKKIRASAWVKREEDMEVDMLFLASGYSMVTIVVRDSVH